MSEINAVVRWDEPELYSDESGHWGEQIGHADEPASEHMPEEADGWYLTLSRHGTAEDWWLWIEFADMVNWEDPCCPEANGIIHTTPTGTRSLAEARTIASAIVAALQHGHMTGTRPLRESAYDDDEEMDSYGGANQHGWCLCEECEAEIEAARAAYWAGIDAWFRQRAATQISSLSTFGPEVSQHLGLGTVPLRFLDIEEES